MEVHPPAPTEAWPPVMGVARVGQRTKDLAKRLLPGEIAVIDHEDLDRVATESLSGRGGRRRERLGLHLGPLPERRPAPARRRPASPSSTASAPRSWTSSRTAPPSPSTATGPGLHRPDQPRARWRPGASARTSAPSAWCWRRPARTMGAELQRFAENTLSYIQQEGHLLVDEPDIPEIAGRLQGPPRRSIVVRGVDYKKDLDLLRRSGYLKEQQPLLVGVDGGADALLELGLTPDVIIGDMDSVSERALRCGAALVVHGYADGRAPGAELPRRSWASSTRCSPRPAPPRTSPCCWPTSGAPSSSSPSAPTPRWSSSSTRAAPAWPRRSSCG